MKYESFHDWILENLPKESILLEFGSGPGTQRFVKNFKVYSIEHDPKWVGYINGTNYIHAPVINNWYDINRINIAIKGLTYDMVLVDGPTGKIGRSGLLNHLSIFNTNIIWVFDDVNRTPELKVMNTFLELTGKKATIFKGINRSFAVAK